MSWETNFTQANGGCEEPEFKDKPQGGITSTVTREFRQGQAGNKAGL